MSPLGGDIESTWAGLRAGNSGIRTLNESFVEDYDLPVRIGARLAVAPAEYLAEREIRELSFTQQMAVALGRQAWRHAGVPEVDRNRLAVAIGTASPGGEAMTAARTALSNQGYRHVSPLTFLHAMPNGPAAALAIELGAKGEASTVVSACASGSEAIANAWRMVTMGESDVVVAGGVEGRIQPLAIAGFAMMRAISTRNSDPERASRPFESDRDGFVFGEAGAVMVIESETHAKARGAIIYARLLGAGITSDGFHLVAPDPQGAGAARAMTRALQRAGLSKSDVSHINAHATATSIGDLAEARAINAAVGTDCSVYAPKSALGHSIGAAGAIESVITVLTIRDNVVAPTLNLENQDPDIDLDVVSRQARHGAIDYALKNSFGFGGHNVTLAFGKY